MSDNAILAICGTLCFLGFFAFLCVALWLDSPRRTQGSITPKETPQTPPRGNHWTIAPYRPQGQPVDLRKTTPPRQPSAVRIPRGGASPQETPHVPPKGGLPPKRGDA